MLEKNFIKFRMDGMKKKQLCNPIHIYIEGLMKDKKINYKYKGCPSLISDFTKGSEALGKFRLYMLRKGAEKYYLNVVAAHEGNGDHKSKEWSARKILLRYRIQEEKIKVDNTPSIFVYDGEWKEKELQRLYRSGWDTVIPVTEIENVLEKM